MSKGKSDTLKVLLSRLVVVVIGVEYSLYVHSTSAAHRPAFVAFTQQPSVTSAARRETRIGTCVDRVWNFCQTQYFAFSFGLELA